MIPHFSVGVIHAAQTSASKIDRTCKDGNIGRVNDVRALIYGWINAWQSKDIDTIHIFL